MGGTRITTLALLQLSDAEVETAYQNQVSIVSQAEAELGLNTTVRRWTAERVKQAIDTLGGGAGGDIPDVLYDSTYLAFGNLTIVSAGTNAFGAWDEYSADIGTGKKLIGFVYIAVDDVLDRSVEFEIGEGAIASEVAISRISSVGGLDKTRTYFPLNRTITNNARISLRVRDSLGAVRNYHVVILVATA